MTTEPSRPSPSEPAPPAGDATRPDAGQEPDVPGQPPVHAYVSRGDEVTELYDVGEIRRAWEAPDAFLWIKLVDPQPHVVAEIAGFLGIHALVAEDIAERNQRAKVELTGDALHLVMFALLYQGELLAVEVDMVLGERFLLTAHDSAWDPGEASPLRRSGVSRYLRRGPDYLLWAITDHLVDGYFPVFDKLGDEIDDLQADVLQRPSSWLVERLFQVRRDLLTIRRAVTPQREIFNQLTNRDMSLIRPERIVYFRDVYDHLIRLTDELDSFREMVGTTLDAYLSTVNNNLSEIMKRLTAVTAVLAGVGALAGVFGMSEATLALTFRDLHFWVVTVTITLLGVGGFLYFRRIGWI